MLLKTKYATENKKLREFISNNNIITTLFPEEDNLFRPISIKTEK